MKRTLIVDDMKKVYDKISGKFEYSEYAGTVKDGLEKIASGNYDLIISDYHLGDEFPQGGLEIIRAAKDKKDKGLKIILMSTENHRKEAKKLEVTFMFKKELFESKNINKLLMDYDRRK